MDKQQIILPKFRLNQKDTSKMQMLMKVYYLEPAELMKLLIRKEYEALKGEESTATTDNTTVSTTTV